MKLLRSAWRNMWRKSELMKNIPIQDYITENDLNFLCPCVKLLCTYVQMSLVSCTNDWSLRSKTARLPQKSLTWQKKLTIQFGVLFDNL